MRFLTAHSTKSVLLFASGKVARPGSHFLGRFQTRAFPPLAYAGFGSVCFFLWGSFGLATAENGNKEANGEGYCQRVRCLSRCKYLHSAQPLDCGAKAILHEAQQLHNVSDRLDSLAEQRPQVSAALITISASVRNTATLLEVLVATKTARLRAGALTPIPSGSHTPSLTCPT